MLCMLLLLKGIYERYCRGSEGIVGISVVVVVGLMEVLPKNLAKPDIESIDAVYKSSGKNICGEPLLGLLLKGCAPNRPTKNTTPEPSYDRERQVNRPIFVLLVHSMQSSENVSQKNIV